MILTQDERNHYGRKNFVYLFHAVGFVKRAKEASSRLIVCRRQIEFRPCPTREALKSFPRRHSACVAELRPGLWRWRRLVGCVVPVLHLALAVPCGLAAAAQRYGGQGYR
jgi:hypothetical protein